MHTSELLNTFIALFSLLVGILAFFNEEHRLLIISLSALFLLGYFLSILYQQVQSNQQHIKTINEQVNIYKQLTRIKADISTLKSKMNKKALTDLQFLNFIKWGAFIALLFVVYKAIMSQLQGS